jgi:hypothetical protein
MSLGRNDPCPCGSGKKYKKCCGAVIPIAAAHGRACGECTACCDGWVVGVIEGHEMKPGTPCHFRGDHCCGIYERRPQHPCREFICGWLQPGNPFPESFRPDRLGVLVIPMKWRGREAYVLRSAGRDPTASCSRGCALGVRTRLPFFTTGGRAFRLRAGRVPREIAERSRAGSLVGARPIR